MHIDEPRLAKELADRHHVTTRKRLREQLKLTDRQVDRLIDIGRLTSKGRGVLALAQAPADVAHRAALGCALTGGVISFPTAGEWWNLRKTPRIDVCHVTVPWKRRLSHITGVHVHRSRLLPPAHIVRRADGISVTNQARTVFDAAAQLGADELESMIEDALYRHLFTLPVLQRVTDVLAHACRDGSALMKRTLQERSPHLRPVASDLELRLEHALRARGFPSLTRQHTIELGGGQQIHPDLGLPDDGFFIEIDHPRWHSAARTVDYDTWRDRQLRLLGLWVERVSDRSITERLAETVDDLWGAWSCAKDVRERSDVDGDSTDGPTPRSA